MCEPCKNDCMAKTMAAAYADSVETAAMYRRARERADRYKAMLERLTEAAGDCLDVPEIWHDGLAAAWSSASELLRSTEIKQPTVCEHAWTPINLSPGFDSQCKKCGMKADHGT